MSGTSNSKGDPRVLLVMNLVLSTLFSWVIISGLAFVGQIEFEWATVALLALVIAVVTHLVIR